MTEQLTGLAAAEAILAQVDGDVTLLWTTKGPKGKQIAEFLFTPPNGQAARVIALALASGRHQFYAPCAIAMPLPPVGANPEMDARVEEFAKAVVDGKDATKALTDK